MLVRAMLEEIDESWERGCPGPTKLANFVVASCNFVQLFNI